MNLNRLYFVLSPLSLGFGGKCSVHVRGNAVLNQVVPHEGGGGDGGGGDNYFVFHRYEMAFKST